MVEDIRLGEVLVEGCTLVGDTVVLVVGRDVTEDVSNGTDATLDITLLAAGGTTVDISTDVTNIDDSTTEVSGMRLSEGIPVLHTELMLSGNSEEDGADETTTLDKSMEDIAGVIKEDSRAVNSDDGMSELDG